MKKALLSQTQKLKFKDVGFYSKRNRSFSINVEIFILILNRLDSRLQQTSHAPFELELQENVFSWPK